MEFTDGSPIWIDLSTSDLKGATAFYADLFGWAYQGTGEEFGNYQMAEVDGAMVAGIGPKMMEGAENMPDAWTVYLKTSDIAASMTAVTAAGGSNVFEPAMVIGDSGSMAICNDGKAFFGLWEPNQHKGFGKVGLGSMVWCELSTSDPTRAKDFYGKAFGFTYIEGEEPMTMFATAESPAGTFSGGIFDHSDKAPEGTPDYWAVYIQCSDINEVCSKTKQAGGTVLVEPLEIPYGTIAVLQDPWGATFCSIEGNESMPSE